MNDLTRLQVSAHLLDMRGRPCPVPIIELAKALRAHACVELWADDPAARADVAAFLQATGHRGEVSYEHGVFRAAVTRRGGG
ncbi:MAG: sulfurtransferase TusA family protein [Archangium sp.]|nr:sulfurtransferase TusA family protein [Archangium sp.]